LGTSFDLLHAGGAFVASFLAGAINSVAGGGTLVTFPTMIWLGLDSVTANATSTVGIWPGTVGSVWGYRRELGASKPRFLALIIPSLVGGLIGALLLRRTPASVFDHLAPFLILFATLLFMAQEPVQRWMKNEGGPRHESNLWFAAVLFFQLLVGLYGGYFGAGIGILMLAALSIMGLHDIHEMNGLKSVFGGSVNGIAALYFVWAHMVDWRFAALMAVASIAGGLFGAGAARKIGRTAVRRIVIGVGLAMALSLFLKK
jgi:uncharacterized protein